MDNFNNGGWWNKSREEWYSLPLKEQEEIAFKATGCLIAYPSWEAPVDCAHTKCCIRRGELLPEALTVSILLSERTNWLRNVSDEEFDRIMKAALLCAKETGIYDPWKMPGGWQVIVFTGIKASSI